MLSEKTVIGLDIGTDSIKMVELKHGKSGYEFLTYGIGKHNLSLEGYWDRTKLRQVSTIVLDIINSGNFSGVKTVMSVQSKDVYVSTMDFDLGMTKDQIKVEINKQAPYFLPYPKDEMRLSWTVIKTDPRIAQYTGKQRVIINALPDFVIDNSKNLLEHVNLDGAALENQSISQIRAALSPDNGNTILMDIGGRHTTFSIVVDGILRSSSHTAVGSDLINKELSSHLGIDDITSEYFKRDLGLINLFQLPKPLQDCLTSLHGELQSFVDLNKKISQNPNKVVMTGGGLLTPGIMQFFRQFPIPVYAANVLRNVYVPDMYRPYVFPIVNQLSTAIGLSMRSDI